MVGENTRGHANRKKPPPLSLALLQHGLLKVNFIQTDRFQVLFIISPKYLIAFCLILILSKIDMKMENIPILPEAFLTFTSKSFVDKIGKIEAMVLMSYL